MIKKDLRIVYLGTPKISAIVLEKLIANGYNIVALVSQADKPQGRKMILMATETKKVAEKYNIPVFQPAKLRDDYAFLYDLKPDIILTMAYGQIIPKVVLDIPTCSPLNLHGSLLPKYRGASPIQAALLNGDKVTGITLMEMVEKMDAGRMFYKKEINISEDDNYETLSLKLADLAYETFDEGIQDVVDGVNKGEEQDENLVSFTKKIKSEDSQITFRENTDEIVNKVRAFYPDPGTFFVYQNVKYKLGKVKKVKNIHNSTPGLIQNYAKNGFFIETADGVVSIEQIQKPGKNMMDFKSFFNGNQNLFKKSEII